MRRRLVTIAIFLLAGAVVNVGVAWGIALRGEPLPTRNRELDLAEAQDVWGRLKPGSWPANPPMLAGDRLEHVGGTTLQAFHPRDGKTPWIDVTMVWEWRVGYPVSTLRYVVRRSDRKTEYVGAMRTVVTLPLMPVWPGFTANTAFYAAILWLLIPGPFALRRLIRRRRGLCPACGYDLRHGEHEACPECGVTA